MEFEIKSIATQPFAGQKPGTSGLRKKVKVFQQKHYLENFVQAVFNTIEPSQRSTLVVGGDGRFYNDVAIQSILKMAVAAGFKRVIVGKNGILSTPAASYVIRKYNAIGGLILSASHNPAGPEEDFGIKFNNASGSPAPEATTQAIYQGTLDIAEYHSISCDDLNVSAIAQYSLNNTSISVIDSVNDYCEVMQTCFDFNKLGSGFSEGELSICFDAMHAVTGPYAKAIFEDMLGAPSGSVINGMPLSDFGGGHPDPNLVHAKELITRMAGSDAPLLGAASDGDGDRNLIAGQNCFVSPSDSLAVIALNHRHIPQYSSGLPGVARSMPTSTALDRVAEKLNIPHYETPTGWKFFGNLLDAGKVSLCGEESFGTSGDHVREKDGIWAVLCWLSIVLETGKTPVELLSDLWHQTGRSFYCRYDFEGVDAANADQVMSQLKGELTGLPGRQVNGYTIESADVFCYQDPIDQSVSDNQGIRIFFTDGSRIVFRLSGTGTDSATIRLYIEQLSHDVETFSQSAVEATKELANAAMVVAKIEALTGMMAPTVIT